MRKEIYNGNHYGYDCTVVVIDEEAYKWNEPTAKLVIRDTATKEIKVCAPIFGKVPSKIEGHMVDGIVRFELGMEVEVRGDGNNENL